MVAASSSTCWGLSLISDMTVGIGPHSPLTIAAAKNILDNAIIEMEHIRSQPEPSAESNDLSLVS